MSASSSTFTGSTPISRPRPLILVNGLAEQSESWFANRTPWSRHFDVKVPEILVYDGDSLHRRIDAGGEVTVDYLTDRLATYLDEFVQRPPYHLVGLEPGRPDHPDLRRAPPRRRSSRLVLICPSGLHGDENLPMMEGVRRSQYDTLVKSVFHRSHFASDELVEAIEQKFQDRKWKKGVLRTLRGDRRPLGGAAARAGPAPDAADLGRERPVISDVAGSIRAADQMLKVRQVVIPKCGHAPQIEKSRLVNQLVLRFLRDRLKTIPPTLDPARFLPASGHVDRPRCT